MKKINIRLQLMTDAETASDA